jgi:tetratricopeptide (TPR) repeat protein
LPLNARSTRFVVLLCALALGVAVAGPAGAQPVTPEESARAHHEQGRLQHSLGRYETAISEYRKAYELRADPSFLFDIAEAYRSLGAAERAVFFYRRYLNAHPNPPNRPEVEAQIARLEPSIPAESRGGSLAAAPAESSSSSLLPTTFGRERAVRDSERSVVGRWWFWTAVGTVAAVGATLAILAIGNRGEQKVPGSDLGHARLSF